jgi:diaminopimelate decarboxylase
VGAGRGLGGARPARLAVEAERGGGYGIAYLPGEVPLDPDRIAKDVASAVAAVCGELGTPLPRISIEPGRAIVGPAGLTLYTVGTVKPVALDDGRVRTYVSVDGGMSDNIRPALYGAHYHAEVVGRASDAEPVLARVVGKHCESGDIVVHEVMLPGDVRAGDLLAVAPPRRVRAGRGAGAARRPAPPRGGGAPPRPRPPKLASRGQT